MPLLPVRLHILPRSIQHWIALASRIAAFTVVAIVILCGTRVQAQQEDAAASSAPTNSVVAVVNADPITQNELATAAIDRFGVDVLDNMVNRFLILQACQARNLEVTKDEVTEEIRSLAEKFGLSLEQYLGLLQEERDIDPGQYSREIIWPMLALRRLASDRIEVSQEEFDKAYVSKFGEAIKCRLIMVSEREKANKLHAQVTADPTKFGSLAKQFSEDETSSSVGGLIPPIRRFSGDTRLEKTAFALADGEVSPILQLGDQWIMLQSVRRIPASTPSPSAMPAIRQQIHDAIRDEKMRETATDIFAGLQRDAKVVKVLGDEALMNQYPGAAAIINGSQITIAMVAAESVKRHGEEVLEGQISRKLLTQALRKDRIEVTQADLQSEIERAAVTYGFVNSDQSPDTKGWLEAVTADGLSQSVYIADSVWPTAALKALVDANVTITQEDMDRGYISNYGPRAEVLAIVLSDQRSAQKVWQSARDDATEEGFAKLAETYSVEPVSASNSGKVPPIQRYGGQPAIEKEVFALQPGQMSGIVVTGGQYVILRLQGFTEPVVSDREAVTEELMRDLTEKKMRKAMAVKMAEIRESAEVDNFLVATKKTVPKVATK